MDGELSVQEEKALYAHLHTCDVCRLEFNEVREIHGLLQSSLVTVEPPADLTNRIMAAIPWESPQASDDVSSLNEEVKETSIRKNWWNAFTQGCQRVMRSWQFRSTAVALGALGIMLLTNGVNTPQSQVAKKQPATPQIGMEEHTTKDTEPDIIALVIPEENNTESSEKNVPHDEVREKPVEQVIPEKTIKPVKNTSNESSKPAEEVVTQEAPEVHRDIIQLPLPASEQNDVYILPELTEQTVAGVSYVKSVDQSVFQPEVLDEGKTLRYVAFNGETYEVWTVALSEGAQPQKLEVPDGTVLNGTLTKDNTALIDNFITSDMKFASLVSDVSPDGANIILNVGNPDGVSAPDLSRGLWLVHTDGKSQMQQMTEIGGGQLIKWSPDGQKITFTSDADLLYVLNLQENILFQVTSIKDINPKQQTLTWTPDSSTIYYDWQKPDDAYRNIYMAKFSN